MKRSFASSSLVVLHNPRPHFQKPLIRGTCNCIATLASFVRTDSLAKRPLGAEKNACALNMDLMSVPSCYTSLIFISCAAVISRMKYCYGSVIVSCGMFTLGAGVTVPEFGSCWVLMWTHRLFNYLRQISGTVAVPEYTDVTLYLGTKESTGHLYSHRFLRPIHCFGSQ